MLIAYIFITLATQSSNADTINSVNGIPETSTNDENIKTVIAEGVGIDPPSAAQNAAQNALTNVAGSFIDANKLLEKKAIITDGIRSETKNISTNIKEYSQGSIKGFEIIDTRIEQGLIKVTAKVSVRNESFSAYMKKLAAGETHVGTSLFAQMATDVKQKSSLIDIIKDNIILPIIKGEVQEFVIDPPTLLSHALNEQSLPKWLASSYYVQQLAAANQNSILLKVKTKLTKGYYDNLAKTLDSSASEKGVVELQKNIRYTDCKTPVFQNTDLCIINKANLESNVGQRFIFKNTLNNLRNEIYWIDFGESLLHAPNYSLLPAPIPSLNVLFKDANNSDLMIKTIKPNSPYVLDAEKYFIPWLLMRGSSTEREYISILNENTFYIVLDVNLDVIKNATKIVVNLQKN